MAISRSPLTLLTGRSRWILLALPVAGLLVALSLQIAHLRDADATAARRQDAVEVAQRVAIGLTSFKSGQSKSALDAVRGDLTGDLSKQVSSERTLLESILKDSAATSSSSVDLAGVDGDCHDTCRVIVALTADTKNHDTPKGEVRRYRMRLTLTARHDKWRASEMEMVP